MVIIVYLVLSYEAEKWGLYNFYKFQNHGLKNNFGQSINIFQSDGGGEYDNSPMQDLFLQTGILFQKSYHDTQALNGVAERKHRHILEMVHGFLIQSLLPP